LDVFVKQLSQLPGSRFMLAHLEIMKDHAVGRDRMARRPNRGAVIESCPVIESRGCPIAVP